MLFFELDGEHDIYFYTTITRIYGLAIASACSCVRHEDQNCWEYEFKFRLAPLGMVFSKK
jgi:hypothetical protein